MKRQAAILAVMILVIAVSMSIKCYGGDTLPKDACKAIHKFITITEECGKTYSGMDTKTIDRKMHNAYFALTRVTRKYRKEQWYDKFSSELSNVMHGLHKYASGKNIGVAGSRESSWSLSGRKQARDGLKILTELCKME
jgi:hypothetical protein